MSILNRLNPVLRSLKPYEPGRPIEEVARELGLDPEGIVKLASNESALGPSPRAIEALQEGAAEVHLYPDGAAWDLRAALADHLGVDGNQLIFGNGSNEVLELLGHCFLRPGVSIVYSAHAFIVYKLVAELFGAESIEVPMTKDLTHDLDAMAAAIRPDTAIVYVCNPNNPTGSMVDVEALEVFLDQVPRDVLVVLDEAYAEIALNRMPPSIEWLAERPNLMVSRSFSKAYGLAGLRIGYGVSHPGLVEAINRARQPFNVNRLAQQAAIAALSDQAFVTSCRELYRVEKEFVETALSNQGLPFVPATANFILVQVGDGLKVAAALRQRGVIVRPMGPYQLPQHIRITLGTRSENLQCLQALQDIRK